MKVFREQRFMMKIEQIPLLVYLLKWIVLSAVSGACIGSASALLLVSLNWATDYRESHLWVLFLLPLAGLLIGLMFLSLLLLCRAMQLEKAWAGVASVCFGLFLLGILVIVVVASIHVQRLGRR